MAKNNNWMWIVGILLVGIIFYKYSSLGAISMYSNQVQYYDKPISVSFSTDLNNFTYQSYFNENEIDTTLNGPYNALCGINQTCLPRYEINYNITQEGTFKLVLSAPVVPCYNETVFDNSTNSSSTTLKCPIAAMPSDIITVEVRKPFVDETNNIPTTLDKGQNELITVSTFNPHNEVLDADSVTLIVTRPDNKQETIEMKKDSTGKFSSNFNYDKAGSYVFKIHASKLGYDTVEKTAITSVLKSSGVPLIMWIWIISGGVILLLVLGRAFLWRRH